MKYAEKNQHGDEKGGGERKKERKKID